MKKFLMILSLAAALTLTGCWGKSDADIQKAAEAAVKAKAPNVTVTVKDGVVTLAGNADNSAMKAAAETAAKVEGVKSVTNNVVTPTPIPAAATDPEKTKIQDALKKAGFTDVTVDTSTTPATLRGTVPKGKMTVAIQAAQEAAGKPVKNEITEK